MPQPCVSIIIVSYNVRDFLDLCLDSVHKATRGIHAEIIVVDNQSQDNSGLLVKNKYPDVILIENAVNAGFSKANNQALAISRGAYIHYLNPDTMLPEDFYRKSLKFMDEHPEAGCLGPRLIDGRGIYAPDSKKIFPSFWVSVYKVMGIARLFQHSKRFNKYYAGHIPEHQTAEVEILSGCCLLVRRSAQEKAGGGFDEAYFMYCEDVDLCHRIRLSGFRNYYFPETTVLHYKGESTKKLSIQYMRIFYEAHALFVRKYYPKRLGMVYNFGLRTVLALRNVFAFGKHLFSLFKLFLLDALLLVLTTLLIKDFWFSNFARITETDADIFLTSLPGFIIVWLLCLFFNGAYDKPFSLYNAARGMLTGTIVVLAAYALLPESLRYSRAVVLFSGMTGMVVLLLARWALGKLRWIRLVPRGKLDYKTAIISDVRNYHQSLKSIQFNEVQSTIIGRIDPESESTDSERLGTLGDIRQLRSIYSINELVFNSNAVPYATIISSMQLPPPLFYKILPPESLALVGSHYGKNNLETYLLQQKYVIGSPGAKRNKRIFDLGLTVALIVLYPFLSPKVLHKKGLWNNIKRVAAGKATWVGYDSTQTQDPLLPQLRPAIVPPFALSGDFSPDAYNYEKLAVLYASRYSLLDDLQFTHKNFRYLGGTSGLPSTS